VSARRLISLLLSGRRSLVLLSIWPPISVLLPRLVIILCNIFTCYMLCVAALSCVASSSDGCQRTAQLAYFCLRSFADESYPRSCRVLLDVVLGVLALGHQPARCCDDVWSCAPNLVLIEMMLILSALQGGDRRGWKMKWDALPLLEFKFQCATCTDAYLRIAQRRQKRAERSSGMLCCTSFWFACQMCSL
jgi:hypothetical protein